MAIPCGTATDPPLCGVCPNRATFFCWNCNNIQYCSKTCQNADTAQHSLLCNSFRDFQDQHRPSPDHRRVILFPENEPRPRFVWLKYRGEPQHMIHDLDDLGRFLPESFECIGLFNRHEAINRQFNNTLWMQASAHGHRLGPNLCLWNLLGNHAAHWRGPVIAMAPTKYRQEEEYWDDREPQDVGITDLLIPLDLDTTSLAPHVDFLRQRSVEANWLNGLL